LKNKRPKRSREITISQLPGLSRQLPCAYLSLGANLEAFAALLRQHQFIAEPADDRKRVMPDLEKAVGCCATDTSIVGFRGEKPFWVFSGRLF